MKKRILSMLLVISMLFSLMPAFSIAASAEETNTQQSTEESALSLTAAKSAQWTAFDTAAKVNIDLEAEVSATAPKVLFVGTLCLSHGLEKGTLEKAINAAAKTADVTYYLLGNTDSQNNVSLEHSLRYQGTLEHGNTLNYEFQPIGGSHHVYTAFVELLYTELVTQGNKYDYIIFSYDSANFANAAYFDSSYASAVAVALKPYYQNNQMIWLCNSKFGYPLANTTSATIGPDDPASYAKTAPNNIRTYAGNSNMDKLCFSTLSAVQFYRLMALVDPVSYLAITDYSTWEKTIYSPREGRTIEVTNETPTDVPSSIKPYIYELTDIQYKTSYSDAEQVADFIFEILAPTLTVTDPIPAGLTASNAAVEYSKDGKTWAAYEYAETEIDAATGALTAEIKGVTATEQYRLSYDLAVDNTVFNPSNLDEVSVGTASAVLTYGTDNVSKTSEAKLVYVHKHTETEKYKLPLGSSFAGGTLTAGSYYLASDLTLTSDIVIPAGAEVSLCLNGHVLNLNGQHQIVNEGTFTLNDCGTAEHKFTAPTGEIGQWTLDETNGTKTVTGGVITGGVQDEQTKGLSIYGGAVWVKSGAVFNMLGGNIVGNKIIAGNDPTKTTNGISGLSAMGGAVYVGGTFNLSGGSLLGNEVSGNSGGDSDNMGGAVYVDSNGTINMTGGTVAYNLAVGADGTDCIGGGGGIFVMSSEKANSISGGTVNNNKTDYLGGGVCVQFAKLQIGGATIENNNAVIGGGVGSYGAKELKLEETTLNKNTASHGAALGAVQKSKVSIVSCIVMENKASGYGGAFYFNAENDVTIEGTAINDNTANSGGAIFTTESTLELSDGTKIQNNKADSYAGGIYAYNNTALTLKGKVDIKGNEAVYAGGIALTDSPLTVSGTAKITGNKAYKGGGVLVQGSKSIVSLSDEPQINSNNGLYGRAAENLSLPAESMVKIVGDLGENASISFTIPGVPSKDGKSLYVTQAYGTDYSAKFTNDRHEYTIEYKDECVCLTNSISWTYEASGASINSYKDGDLNDSITIIAPEDTAFDGTAKSVTLSGSSVGAVTGITASDVKYCDANGIEALPTDPGTYTAKLTVEGKTAVLQFTVGAAPVVLTAEGKDDRYYNNISEALAAMTESAETNGTISVNTDIKDSFTVPAGMDITIDLKGNVIKPSGSGDIITNNGTLEIKSTANNTAVHSFWISPSSGQWVLSDVGAETVKGAVIAGAKGGIGIVNNGTMTISNVSVLKGTDSAKDFVDNGTLTMKGKVRIDRFYLEASKTVNASELASGSSVGVITRMLPDESNEVSITGINNADISGFFTSLDSQYFIRNSDNVVVLDSAQFSVKNVTMDIKYLELDDALAGARDGDIIRLLRDVRLTKPAYVDGITATLELDGFALDSNNKSGIYIESGALTVIGGNETRTHYLSYNPSGVWSLIASPTAAQIAAAVDLDSIDENTTVVRVTGGVITGGTYALGNNRYDGGGIIAYNGDLSVSNVSIVGNCTYADRADANGGGIFFFADNAAHTLSVSGCTIAYNKCLGAQSSGGGIYIGSGGSGNANVSITDSSITNNSAAKSAGIALNSEAITISGKTIIADNCTTAGEYSNLCCAEGAVTLNTPAADTSIGVTLAEGSGRITTDSSADYSQYFTSDIAKYSVENNNTDGENNQYVKLQDELKVCNIGQSGNTKQLSYYSIKEALESADFTNGDTLKLIADLRENISADGTKQFTLDLNGHVLTAPKGNSITSGAELTLIDSAPEAKHTGGNSSLPDGGVITGATAGFGVRVGAQAVFNMYGGTVCGNKQGVDVAEGGTFNMYDGATISGNTCDKVTEAGAGVHNLGTFNMTGGSIRDNTSSWLNERATVYGGGVYNGGTFTMTGGSITNNKILTDNKSYGGGVYNFGTMTVGGTARIFYNKRDKIAGNVYIAEGNAYKLWVSTETAPTDMKIGVALKEGNGRVTQNSSADYVKYFISDNDRYIEVNNTDGGTGKQFVELQDMAGCVYNPRTGVTTETIADALISDYFQNGDTLKLIKDLEENVVIPCDKTVTIDLNGRVLSQKGSPSSKNLAVYTNLNPLNPTSSFDLSIHSVIFNAGTLTITDSGKNREHYFTVDSNGLWKLTDTKTADTKTVFGGVITGGQGTFNQSSKYFEYLYGGGICNFTYGKLTLKGGTICGNYIDGSNLFSAQYNLIYGGGVSSCDSSSSLTISGAVICGNRSSGKGGGIGTYGGNPLTITSGVISDNVSMSDGGGVSFEGNNFTSFCMTGGEISGNTVMGSGIGGGVYLKNSNYTKTIGGTARITGNKVGTVESNLLMPENNSYLLTVTDPAEGMLIGVTINGGMGKVTGSNGANEYAKYFKSDNAEYTVQDVLDEGSETAKHVEICEPPRVELINGSTNQSKGKFASITSALGSASFADGDTIKLLADLKESFEVNGKDYENGLHLTLDLNGHVLESSSEYNALIELDKTELTLIDSAPTAEHTGDYASLPKGGVLTRASCKSCVYTQSSASIFNMRGGTIYGNTVPGVHIISGTFNMYGGAISNNNVKPACFSAGVIVESNATFNMYDGTIKDNTITYSQINATRAGGVYVGEGGTFTMTGGSITGNTNTNKTVHGGVYNNGTMTVGGTAVISGNTGFGGAVDNLGGGLVNVSTQTLPAEGMNIGVTYTGAVTTSNGANDYARYFTSDKAEYETKDVLNEGSETDKHVELVKLWKVRNIGQDGNVKNLGYDTISAALQSASFANGDTIKLFADLTENVTIAEGKTVTIDLNGFVLNQTATKSVIHNNGNLTIMSSDTEKEHYFSGGKGKWSLLTGSSDGAKLVKGGIITGGKATSGEETKGGGIYNSGTLTVSRGVGIVGNSALNYGGGIYNEGKLSIDGAVFCGNTSNNYGGGLSNSTNEGAELTVKNASFYSNIASVGGGILLPRDSVSLENISVTGNTGGGIAAGYIDPSTIGTVQLTLGGRMDISGNKENRGKTNNLMLLGSSKVNISAETPLETGSNIGVTLLTSTGSGTGTVTTANASDMKGFFTSDEGYMVKNAAGNIVYLGDENHSHSWSISSSGDTIKAVCLNEDCDYPGNDLKLTISYDAGQCKAALSSATFVGETVPEIKYKTNGSEDETATTAIPSKSGLYTAFAVISGEKVSIDFELDHNHVWDYSAATTATTNDTINAACVAMGTHIKGVKSVTSVQMLAPTSTTYDGNAKQVTFYDVTAQKKLASDAVLAGFETMPAVSYSKKNASGGWDLMASGTLPTDVGDYKASITILDTSEPIVNNIGASVDNFFVTIQKEFTISPATVTVTADTLSKTYGESDPTLTATVTGWAGTAPDFAVTREAGSDAGTYAISVAYPEGKTAADYPNYTITLTGATFTINQKQLTVSGSTATSRAYDGTKDIAIVLGTISGYQYSDTATDVAVTAAGTVEDENASTAAKDVTVTYSISGDNAKNYLAPEGATLSATISKASQTISAPTAQTANIGCFNISLDAAAAGQGTTYYAKSTSNSKPAVDSTAWQTGTEFTGLSMDTEYYFFVKYAETDNYNYAVSEGSKIKTLNHYHDWTYELAQGTADTINAVCIGPGGETSCNSYDNTLVRSIKLSATDTTYDGNAHPASLSKTSLAEITTLPSIKYQLKNADDTYGTATETAPTAAGTYKASFTVTYGENSENSVTAAVEYTISNADMTAVSVSQKDPLTYNGTAQTATVNTSATTTNSQTATFTYSATATGIYSATVPSFTDAGDYTVYYKVSAPNHNEKSDSFTVTIAKKAISNANTQIKLGAALYADGTEKTQIVAKVTADSLVLDRADYTVSGNKNTQAGSYTLTVTAKDDSNFTGEATKVYTINTSFDPDDFKAEADIKTESIGITTELKMTEEEALKAVVSQDEIDELKDGDKLHVKLIVAKVDSDKVEDETKEKILDLVENEDADVRKEVKTYIDVSMIKWRNNDTANAEEIHETAQEVEIVIDVPVNDIGNHKNFWVVRYHDGVATLLEGAYDSKTHELKIKTDKFSDYAIVCSVPAENATAGSGNTGLVYNAQAQTLVTDGTVDGGWFVYSYEKNATYVKELPKKTDAGTYTVYYKAVGDENHDDPEAPCEGSFSVTIAKKPVTITADALSKTYSFADPTLTAKVSNDLCTGDKLYYTVTRAAGEDVKAGGYAIAVNAPASYAGYKNANYDISTVGAVFTIEQKSGTGFEIMIPTVVYTGTQKKPVVTVKDGNKVLELNKDYTAAYGTNVEPGTNAGSVTITFIGNYTGSTTRYFTINRLSVSGDAEARHTDVKTYEVKFDGARPEGTTVLWKVRGKCAVTSGYTGDTITVICDGTGSFTLTAQLVDENGELIKDVDGNAVQSSITVNVKIKTGDYINALLDTIMNIFHKLFGWIKFW